MRRRIQDLVNVPVAIMRNLVEPKEKGRRRTSGLCCICMEEYEFMSIDEITREKCCVRKQQNVDFTELFVHCGERRK